MKPVPKKKAKVQLIKILAMTMSICYLANPLQRQINIVLHELSHGLELPSHVLSHENTTNMTFMADSHHSHGKSITDHTHHLIDFLDTLFEASNEDQGSEDPLFLKSKLDKHLTYYELLLPSYFEIVMLKCFIPPKGLQTQGLFKDLDHPPQYLLG
ncbi:MAG: hypothetical protein Mars2KO_09830 [Maribacter sp.]